MTPESLAHSVEDFLLGMQNALVVEDGDVIFDLARARYSVSGEQHKCLLHMWSAERNVVRRVLDCEIKNEVLRLQVQRLGQTKPTRIEICRNRDWRTPTARRVARLGYQRLLEKTLLRGFAGFTLSHLTTSTDLKHSFGPIYTRGIIQRGQSAFALLGVNAQEAQASIDAALTFGILWLDYCRANHAGKLVIEGLKLFLPERSSGLARERMAHLDRAAAKWQLYELQERDAELREIDISDCGNVATRLVQAPDEASTLQRFAEPIGRIRDLMPEVEIALLSSAEIAFRRFGLEFARARLAHDPESFRPSTEIVFGAGGAERILTASNWESFSALVRSIGDSRHPRGPRDHPLWRMHPERWLESLAVLDLSVLDGNLAGQIQYSQVPAFSASDRAMIDVLTVTREGRLAVIELKADEDIHLPLQGLDYWARVAWHDANREFQRFGYFPGVQISSHDPVLYLVAPVLRVHPATDVLLHYFSPKIDWVFVGIDERWRENLRTIFRKRSGRRPAQPNVA
ncbi:MAG: hypothetical protein ACRD2U_14740 [Terriglobales bacterium]